MSTLRETNVVPITVTVNSPKASSQTEERSPYTYTLVTEDNHQAAIEAISTAEYIGLDVECDVVGEKPNGARDKLVGIGIALPDGECYYYPTGQPLSDISLFGKLRNKPYYAHNAKYDLAVCKRYCIGLGSLAGDGMLAAYLMGEPERGLKPLVLELFGITMLTYDQVTGGKNISSIDPERVAEYCCADAYYGMLAARKLEDDLTESADDRGLKIYKEMDLPLVPVLVDMELAGIGLDVQRAIDRLIETMTERDQLGVAIDYLAKETGFSQPDRTAVCKGCRNGKVKRGSCATCKGQGKYEFHQPLNPGSTQQVVAWLHGILDLPIQGLTDGGEPSMGKLQMLRLRGMHPGASLIFDWNRLDKEKGFLLSWLDQVSPEGRLHTSFSNAFVQGGRLSSREPNMQQVKLAWREVFIA
ncbi:hypothetical protein LCGC14_1990470, partial [marine sediment metagenome]